MTHAHTLTQKPLLAKDSNRSLSQIRHVASGRFELLVRGFRDKPLDPVDFPVLARPWKVTASESGWKELGRPGRGWKSKYYSGGWGRGREQMIGLRISVFFGIPGDLWGFFGIPWDFFGIPWISLFPFLPQCGSCCADKENLLMVRLQSRFAEEPL